jgi:hypothetical protein
VPVIILAVFVERALHYVVDEWNHVGCVLCIGRRDVNSECCR